MCKAPRPGAAKTRLAKVIGAVAASELSACFLRDVAAAIEAVPETVGRKGYAVYAPAGTEQMLRGLFPEKFGLLLKAGEDLGDALFGATRDLLLAGHDCVLLVNGDSPTLPSRFLVQAIEALRGEGDRLVLGPASDGGYYLIGLKSPHRQLFTKIEWGTDTVFSRTCAQTLGTNSEGRANRSAARDMSSDRGLNEWNLLREQFLSFVREGSDNIEDIFDAEFRRRFAELIDQTAQGNSTSAYNWPRRLAGNVHANRSRRAVR